MTEAKAEYTIADAQAAIEADKKRRIQEFDVILRQEAQRLSVDMLAVPMLTEDGRTVAQIRYVAR